MQLVSLFTLLATISSISALQCFDNSASAIAGDINLAEPTNVTKVDNVDVTFCLLTSFCGQSGNSTYETCSDKNKHYFIQTAVALPITTPSLCELGKVRIAGAGIAMSSANMTCCVTDNCNKADLATTRSGSVALAIGAMSVSALFVLSML